MSQTAGTAESHDNASSARPKGLRSPPFSAAVFSTRFPSSSVNSICGAMAGIASGIVTCPLDVIKTKLQAQGSFRQRQIVHNPPTSSALYRGLLGTARTIIKQDGLRGMYRGLGPMLLGYLPTWAVYMSVYDVSKRYYQSKTDNKWLASVYASVSAGACSTLATNPIWVIKTRLMSQVSKSASKSDRTPWHYNNTFDAARKMYASEGIGAFYSGLAPALLGLTHVAIQFPLYEYFKMRFTGVEMGQAADQHASVSTVGILGATFLSKICATTATYPHEVVRTRLQTQQRSSTGQPKYRGVIRTCKVILAEEGWRAFYNGMGTNMIRAVPAAMTTMVTYETLKTAFLRLQEQGRAIQQEEMSS